MHDQYRHSILLLFSAMHSVKPSPGTFAGGCFHCAASSGRMVSPGVRQALREQRRPPETPEGLSERDQTHRSHFPAHRDADSLLTPSSPHKHHGASVVRPARSLDGVDANMSG